MPDLPPRTPVSSVDPDAPLERVRGVVVRVTYENPDNDYRVVKMIPDGPVAPERLDKRREVVLVGALPGIGVGETIEAEGRWGRHAQHGPQFRCDWFKPSLPTGARGIEAYLGSDRLGSGSESIERHGRDGLGCATLDGSLPASASGLDRSLTTAARGLDPAGR